MISSVEVKNICNRAVISKIFKLFSSILKVKNFNINTTGFFVTHLKMVPRHTTKVRRQVSSLTIFQLFEDFFICLFDKHSRVRVSNFGITFCGKGFRRDPLPQKKTIQIPCYAFSSNEKISTVH